jgi:hypothetical protein
MRGSDEKKSYVRISEGKVREKVNKDTPGAVHRSGVTMDGREFDTWEIVDGWIQGHISKLAIQRHEEYGDAYQIHIRSGVDVDVLQMKTKSFLSTNLINKLANCDFSQQVKITPKLYGERTFVFVEQAGEDVPNLFTKEEPGRAPNLSKETSETPKAKRDAKQKREVEIWKIDFLSFYEEFFTDVLTPKVANIAANVAIAPPDPDFNEKEEMDLEMDRKIDEDNPPEKKVIPEMPEDSPPTNDLPFAVTILLAIGTLTQLFI